MARPPGKALATPLLIMEGADMLLCRHGDIITQTKVRYSDIITQTKILNRYDVIVPAIEREVIPSVHSTLARLIQILVKPAKRIQ